MLVEDFLVELRSLSDAELIERIDVYHQEAFSINDEIEELLDAGAPDELLEEEQSKWEIAEHKRQLSMDVIISRNYTWNAQSQSWEKRREEPFASA